MLKGRALIIGLTMGAVALLVRAALIAASTRASGISLTDHALFHDGWEYLRLAHGFSKFDLTTLDPETLRLFPGYPLTIALFGFLKAPVILALSISLLSAASLPWLTNALAKREDLGWWLIALTPSWLVYTSTVMSEGLSALTIALCLLTIQRERWRQAGLLAGLSTLVRPVGCFLFLVIAWEAWRQRSWRPIFRSWSLGLPFPLLYLLLSRFVWGDALQSVNSYAERDFAFPLSSFLTGPFDSAIELEQRTLLLAVLLVTFAGLVGLTAQVRMGQTHLRPLLVWHSLALVFYLLIPSDWAFKAFDRFALAVWPTTVVGLSFLIPRRRWLNITLAALVSAVSFIVAYLWLTKLASVYPFDERALPF